MNRPTPSPSSSAPAAPPAMAGTRLQQPLHHPMPGRVARQQQQSNGFPEFQPKGQMGEVQEDDRAYTLSAYLERAGRAGDLPVARLHDLSEARSRRLQQQQG